VWPPRDAELPAPLLQHRDPNFELLHCCLDRHAEVSRRQLELSHLLSWSNSRMSNCTLLHTASAFS
jgi:hypothetical protein